MKKTKSDKRAIISLHLGFLLMLVPVFAYADASGERGTVDDFVKKITGEHTKVTLNARLRYEGVDQDNLEEKADAITLRTRYGLTGKYENGFSFLAEGETIVALVDDYNAAGREPGKTAYPVVADPEDTELNQLWGAYKNQDFSSKVGRQILTFDDHRWVGHVGWRQNIQTLDAVFLNQKFGNFELSYAFVDRVNRIFGKRDKGEGGVDGHFDSNSHLLNGSLQTSIGKITGFAYLLDFENGAAVSSQTYGVLLAGSHKLPDEGEALNYTFSFANQSDYGNNPTDYSAWYVAADIAYKVGKSHAGAGYEILGSDDGAIAVSTPLATLHKFNGWADVFLGTPSSGLRDLYFYAGHVFEVGKGLTSKLFYHKFQSDEGSLDLGSEWDLILSYPLHKSTSATLKWANYEKGDVASYPGRSKLWLQLDFNY